MTQLVPFKSIWVPTHQFFYANHTLSAGALTEPRKIEEYAGWVEAQVDIDIPTDQDDFLSLVPTPAGVLDYSHDEILFSTVTVAPAAVEVRSDGTDQALFAVNDADVSLRFQSTLTGDPICLVLRAGLAILRGNLLRYTYHITLQTRAGTPPEAIAVDGNVEPAA